MKCAHCGADLNSFQAYCMNCGAKVEQDQEVAATPVAEEAVTDVPETETETEAEAEAMDTAETAEPANEDSQPDSEPQEQQAQTAVAAQAAAAAAASATTRVYRDPFNAENQGKSNYRDPFAPQPNENNNYSQHYYGEKPVSMGNWLGSLFLLLLTPIAISIINGIIASFVGSQHIVVTILSYVALFSPLVLALIWAFSPRVRPSKRNFFRAAIIFYLILIVIILLLSVMFTSFFTYMFSSPETQELMQYIQSL